MDTFERTIAGRQMTIRIPARASLEALDRFRITLVKKLNKLSESGKAEDEKQARKLVTEFDMKLITLIESLVIEAEDLDHLVEAQLLGNATPGSMMSDIIRLDESPDDDEDVIAKPVKKAPNPLSKATAAKKIANARRTKN